MKPNQSHPQESLADRIHGKQATERRMDRLEDSVARMKLRGTSMTRKWRIRVGSLIIALVSVSALAVAAITANTNSFAGAKADVYSYNETTFTVVSRGMDVTATSVAAAGNAVGTPIEVGVALGAANTALSAGDWYYAIDVKEASVAVLVTGTWKAELFMDGTSQGALYLTQVSADASAVEGVTMKWSLGSVLPANSAYVVKITAV